MKKIKRMVLKIKSGRVFLIFGLVCLLSGLIFLRRPKKSTFQAEPLKEKTFADLMATASATPSFSPSPTPSPSPLTFSQLNQLYGPCVVAPTLMYHHVVDPSLPNEGINLNISINIGSFRSQMQDLRERGYNVVSMVQLQAFFDQGQGLPSKPVLLTFDDAYQDFNTYALPILQELGFPATVFVPTGLVDNPGYLSWGQMSQGLVLYANHTWSHQTLGADLELITKEIGLADTQLSQHGLNSPKVFSYPYGFSNGLSKKFLAEKGYVLAFTTNYGVTLCRALRLELPRVRVGNGSLASYGF